MDEVIRARRGKHMKEKTIAVNLTKNELEYLRTQLKLVQDSRLADEIYYKVTEAQFNYSRKYNESARDGWWR